MLFLEKGAVFAERVPLLRVGVPPCPKREFATLHRLLKYWPPDWTAGYRRRRMRSETWRHISGVVVTRTSPILSFSSLISSFNSMDNFITCGHLKFKKVQIYLPFSRRNCLSYVNAFLAVRFHLCVATSVGC